MSHRFQKLRQKLAEKGLEAILISQAENRRYLSGFSGSAGFLLISQDTAILATDFRYVEQAKAQAPDFEIVQIKGEAVELIALASERSIRQLGFEDADLSFAIYQRLTEEATRTHHQLELIPSRGLVETLRAVKDEGELDRLVKAAELADEALEYILYFLRPGMKEKDVAWEAEKFLRQRGSEPLPFDIIVASGPNSALPHAQPTERPISEGEPIMIDLGAQVEGYCSDLSRTLCLGTCNKGFSRVYDLVLGAQLTAIATLKPGMSGKQADRLARGVIEEGGYGNAFGHSLGHGVGLAAHEEPRLGLNSESPLTEGMVFTIEPGIYIKDWGGVRIEDTAVMGKSKVKVLTKARK